MNWFPFGVVWFKCRYLPIVVVGMSAMNAPNNNYNIFVYGNFLLVGKVWGLRFRDSILSFSSDLQTKVFVYY